MKEEKINANIMFEMLGRPVEHLVETMNQLIEAVNSEKGVRVIKRQVHEPKKIDNKDKDGNLIAQGELFSTFCEIEVEIEGIMNLLMIGFKYLPSHIEIIRPEEFNLMNVDFNLVVNEILARLHNYDAIAKSALMNNELLNKKLEEKSKNNAVPFEVSYGKPDKKESKKKKK